MWTSSWLQRRALHLSGGLLALAAALFGFSQLAATTAEPQVCTCTADCAFGACGCVGTQTCSCGCQFLLVADCDCK